jgi:hypothetical protein
VGFQSRHPEIVLRIPEPTSVARTKGFNCPPGYNFYNILWEQVEKNSVTASTLYNMDETGVHTTSNKPPKI